MKFTFYAQVEFLRAAQTKVQLFESPFLRVNGSLERSSGVSRNPDKPYKAK